MILINVKFLPNIEDIKLNIMVEVHIGNIS